MLTAEKLKHLEGVFNGEEKPCTIFNPDGTLKGSEQDYDKDGSNAPVRLMTPSNRFGVNPEWA